MRIVSTNSLKGSEILGKPIYDETGRTLLGIGVKLTAFYIDRLKSMGILSVYIDDDISKGVVPEESISEKTRQMSKLAVKDMVDKYARDGLVSNDGIVKSVNSIIDDILAQREVLVNVSDIRVKDDSLYSHSVNVCVLSVAIGIHAGYNMLKLKEVAVGALLHDIGKIKALSDQRMHPKAGYEILGSQNTFSAITKVAVLMHHENMDGTGYPLGLKGKEINDAARLVSICNVFDNLVSGSIDGCPKPVYEALEFLTGMSGYYFDGELVKKFTSHIAAFPSGSGVRLNTNERCLVVRQNKALPLRPVVRVIFDKSGIKVSEPFEIDLNNELTLFITGVCDI